MGKRIDPVSRLHESIRISDSGCWEWQRYISYDGYGRVSLRRNGGPPRGVPAHRWAYEVLIGPIPEGLEIDHLCRVRHCVNPAHLEPVTRKENARRSELARATHCKRGHPFDEENTIRRSNGTRGCRACARERDRIRSLR